MKLFELCAGSINTKKANNFQPSLMRKAPHDLFGTKNVNFPLFVSFLISMKALALFVAEQQAKKLI